MESSLGSSVDGVFGISKKAFGNRHAGINPAVWRKRFNMRGAGEALVKRPVSSIVVDIPSVNLSGKFGNA